MRGHLAPISTTRTLLRFLENHDEPRAAATLPVERERAAAVAIATLPGATLWHEGQFEGRRVRLPVFLARRPASRPTPAAAVLLAAGGRRRRRPLDRVPGSC